MTPDEYELARGKWCLVHPSKSSMLPPLEGRLYNVDPATKSVILVMPESGAFKVILEHAIGTMDSEYEN